MKKAKNSFCTIPVLLLLIIVSSISTVQHAFGDEHSGIPFLSELCRCEWIAIAEYKGFTAPRVVTPATPPIAMYRIKKQLRGLRYPTRNLLPIMYEFDRSESQEPQTKAKKQEMPKKGSKWILFLPEFVANHQGFRTFQGGLGRVEYSDENLRAVLSGMKVHWKAQQQRRQPAPDQNFLQPGQPPP